MLVLRVALFNCLCQIRITPNVVAAHVRPCVRIGSNTKLRHEREQKSSTSGLSCLDGNPYGGMSACDSSKSFVATPYRTHSPINWRQNRESSSPVQVCRLAPTFPHFRRHSPCSPQRSFSCLRKRYNVTLRIWGPPEGEGGIPMRALSCSRRPVLAGMGDWRPRGYPPVRRADGCRALRKPACAFERWVSKA
jgi:hypothetical protein